MDLKIYILAKTRDCDLTGDNIYRFLPKLSLCLPSQEAQLELGLAELLSMAFMVQLMGSNIIMKERV
jgi:hypothetical protein